MSIKKLKSSYRICRRMATEIMTGNEIELIMEKYMDKLDIIIESFNNKIKLLGDEFDELVDFTETLYDLIDDKDSSIKVLKQKLNDLNKDYEYLLLNHNNIIEEENKNIMEELSKKGVFIDNLKAENDKLKAENIILCKKIKKLELDVKYLNNQLKSSKDETEYFRELIEINDNAELLKEIVKLKKLLKNANYIIDDYSSKMYK